MAPRRCVLSSSLCPVAASTVTTTRLRYFSSRPGRFQTPPQTCSMAVSKNGRIASAGCRRLAGRCTEHLLTDLWAARPCVLCRGVHRYFSFHWTDHWRTEHWTERSKHNSTVLDCQVQIRYHSGHGERARTRNGEGARDARTNPPSRSRAPRREGRRRYEPGRRPGTHRRQP